jgi:hypothetical protein
MASITIDPATLCIRLVCGAGEADVSFDVPAIYKAWKDWFVTSDNSKYLPAFDSAGGDPVGASNLDNVYFLQTQNGWLICPQTVEPEVIIRLSGNLFPDVVGAPLFGYDYVVAAGHTHIETVVSTSARQIETGVSGLTTGESADLAAIAAKVAAIQLAAGLVLSDIKAVNGYTVTGAGTSGNPWGPS